MSSEPSPEGAQSSSASVHRDAQDRHFPPSSEPNSHAPLVPDSNGSLSKIYGSLVEPETKRQKWACHGCGNVFPRDATIYLAPQSTARSQPLQSLSSNALDRRLGLNDTTQQHYCRPCYTATFSLGNCTACALPVLGSTKEDGKYVQSGLEGNLWHGRCWTCVHCETRENVNLGLTGLPTCDTCFDRPQPRVPVHSMQPPTSPSKYTPGSSPYKRVSPTCSTNALSGSATRQKMGTTIAELSRKFGHASADGSPNKGADEPDRPPGSSSQSPSLSRNGSTTNRARPLTAQFSGQSFNLAAFQPSTPQLGRSDSRSRPTSPMKDPGYEAICAKCLRGPTEGPENSSEARMVLLEGGKVQYHCSCFVCCVCDKPIEGNSMQSFVRMDTDRFAHPNCAPPPKVVRTLPSHSPIAHPAPRVAPIDHVTHQREPRPSVTADVKKHWVPQSYLHAGTNRTSCASDPVSSVKPRRFHPTSGAAPPTNSTLIGNRNTHHSQASAISSLAVGGPQTRSSASLGKFNQLGGMQSCGGCGSAVSSLESIPGPRGQRWHRKCLICTCPSDTSRNASKACGKMLDSSAKVTAEGQVRCRECYDREHTRHRVRGC